MSSKHELITLTFGDMAENHVGMEQIGKIVDKGQGFQLDDLKVIKNNMEELGCECELISLAVDYDEIELYQAYVLVKKIKLKKSNKSNYLKNKKSLITIRRHLCMVV